VTPRDAATRSTSYISTTTIAIAQAADARSPASANARAIDAIDSSVCMAFDECTTETSHDDLHDTG
jgi:hypothetical protein